jgi:hypothetical protein
MPGRNALALPGGGVVEVRNVYTTAGVLSQWGLSLRETLSAQYVRL